MCVCVNLIKRKLSRGVFRTFQTFNGRDQSGGMGPVEVGQVPGIPGVLKPETVQWPLGAWPHHTLFICSVLGIKVSAPGPRQGSFHMLMALSSPAYGSVLKKLKSHWFIILCKFHAYNIIF